MRRPTARPQDLRVCVIGAGIGGLTAALRSKKKGFSPTVFEASARAGGTIQTIQDGPWRMEFGPNTIPDRGGVISALIRDLGIEDRRALPNPQAHKRYIVRGGTPIALPSSPREALSTPLLSPGAKLRLLAEPFISASQERDEETYDESLYNFARRRLGEEVVDYMLDPFIAGTYAGDPRSLSSHHVLKRLGELERDYGSLMRGGFLAARAARRQHHTPPARGGAALVNFDQGVQTLTDTMARQLGDDLHLSARVARIAQLERGDFHVWLHGEEQPQRFDAVICCTKACALARIHIEDARREPQDLSPIFNIPHPPMAMLALGFRRSQVAHALDGFGMLIPSREHRDILGAVFASTIFSERAPRDHVLLVCFMGGRQPHMALLPEEQKITRATSDLSQLLGIQGPPVYTRTRVWQDSIPQYEIGHGRILQHAARIEDRMPGLRLLGNWRDGISVADVVQNASAAADHIHRLLYP